MSHTEIMEAGQSKLPELVEEINAQIESAKGHARSALQYELDAEQLLNKANAMVPHGKWNDWLVENGIVAPRTAKAFMRLVKSMPLLTDANAQRVAGLRVREAVRAIATSPYAPLKSTATSNSPTRPQDDRDRVPEKLVEGAKALRQAARRIGGCIRYLAVVLYWTARHRSIARGLWATEHELGAWK